MCGRSSRSRGLSRFVHIARRHPARWFVVAGATAWQQDVNQGTARTKASRCLVLGKRASLLLSYRIWYDATCGDANANALQNLWLSRFGQWSCWLLPHRRSSHQTALLLAAMPTKHVAQTPMFMMRCLGSAATCITGACTGQLCVWRQQLDELFQCCANLREGRPVPNIVFISFVSPTRTYLQPWVTNTAAAASPAACTPLHAHSTHASRPGSAAAA